MLIKNLNQIIDVWVEALKQYSLTGLHFKPSAKSWSLGQLYLHLIDDTNFYIEQIKICTSSDDNAGKEATAFAENLFENNSFPDERLKGASDNDSIPQPLSKEDLLSDFINLKNELNILAELTVVSRFKGKAKHPGFEYLNANEWLQLAEMHFRHHLKQKKRIDDFLSSQV